MALLLDEKQIKELAQDDTLTRELLQIHLQKVNKVDLFHKAFKQFTSGGRFAYSFTFSVYAAIFPVMYFLYRKLYMAAVAFILAGLFISILPAGYYLYETHAAGETHIYLKKYAPMSTLFIILQPFIAGGIAKFLYIRKFLNDLARSQFGRRDIESVKQELAGRGGYHQSILVLGAIIVFLSIFGMVMMI